MAILETIQLGSKKIRFVLIAIFETANKWDLAHLKYYFYTIYLQILYI